MPLAVIGTLLVGATARLFVWPSTDDPRRADAVVVLVDRARRMLRWEPQVPLQEGVRRQVTHQLQAFADEHADARTVEPAAAGQNVMATSFDSGVPPGWDTR